LGALLTQRADVIAKKIKILKSETILIWLIFAVANFEFSVAIAAKEAGLIEALFLVFFFPFLAIAFGLYAIISYNKKQKEKEGPKKVAKVEKAVIPERKPEPIKAEISEEKTVFCIKCGSKNPAKNKYCISCGAEIYKSQ
jgi:hypothetical protein